MNEVESSMLYTWDQGWAQCLWTLRTKLSKVAKIKKIKKEEHLLQNQWIKIKIVEEIKPRRWGTSTIQYFGPILFKNLQTSVNNIELEIEGF